MRLGQLARHLETTTSEIIQFLAEEGVDKKDHPNVKLGDELEATVINHFRPELNQVEEGTVPEQIIPPEEDATEDPAEVVEMKENDPAVEEPSMPETPEVSFEPEEEYQEDSTTELISVTAAELNAEDEESAPALDTIGLIKAPKVELPGLKVVGKIDLPKPKEKEPETGNENEEADTHTSQEVTSEEPKVIRHHRKNSRRKLTEEELEARRLKNKREKARRLARQEAKRKEQEEKRIKKQKEIHYKQKIHKSAAANNTKKRKPTKRTALSDTKPKPKTLLGKFWRWLNT